MSLEKNIQMWSVNNNNKNNKTPSKTIENGQISAINSNKGTCRCTYIINESVFACCCPARSRIFRPYAEVTVEGLQCVRLYTAHTALEQRGIFIMPHLLWHGTRFSIFFFFCSLIHRFVPIRSCLRAKKGYDLFKHE